MQIKGDYTISAPRERVWEYFTNPELLQQCIPGCEELKPLGDDSFEATIKVGVAMIKGVYQGSVKIKNKQPPSTYRLDIQGESKIGFVNGACDFTLEETAAHHTSVNLTGELTVGGKLARVGQRVIGGASNMMIGKFFSEVEQLVNSEVNT